jgi:hypothetical protein
VRAVITGTLLVVATTFVVGATVSRSATAQILPLPTTTTTTPAPTTTTTRPSTTTTTGGSTTTTGAPAVETTVPAETAPTRPPRTTSTFLPPQGNGEAAPPDLTAPPLEAKTGKLPLLVALSLGGFGAAVSIVTAQFLSTRPRKT